MQAARNRVSGRYQRDEADEIDKMRDGRWKRADEIEPEDEMKSGGTDDDLKMEGSYQPLTLTGNFSIEERGITGIVLVGGK